jgi:hypothetical protein
MPGFADWKELYKEEYQATTEEGYAVGALPPPAQLEDETLDESAYKALYEALWAVRGNGMRSDYSYEEPNEIDQIFLNADNPPETELLDPPGYRERIRGAWLGRVSGVVLGKPLEMGWGRQQIKDYLESVGAYPLDDWVPARSDRTGVSTREDCLPSTRGNIRFVQPDDDIHYTILALLLAETRGPEFTVEDVARNWLDNIPYHWVWCASRQAFFRLISEGTEESYAQALPRITGALNPWRECIDGQLRGDLWGYVNPGSPRAAAKFAHRDCSLSLVRNGLYGGMFVAACIAQALTRAPTIDSIIAGGLSAVPRKSRFYEMVNRVTDWYATDRAWEPVCRRIEETYGHLPYAGTLNNMAVVVLALLSGELDHSRSITTSVMCGFDTDCTTGTVGSIVGAAVGASGIETRWWEPFRDEVHTVVAHFGHGTIGSLIDRTISVSERFSAG